MRPIHIQGGRGGQYCLQGERHRVQQRINPNRKRPSKGNAAFTRPRDRTDASAAEAGVPGKKTVVGYVADFMERGWVADQPQRCG